MSFTARAFYLPENLMFACDILMHEQLEIVTSGRPRAARRNTPSYGVFSPFSLLYYGSLWPFPETLHSLLSVEKFSILKIECF